ncbi:MAG: type II secretion system protein GspG [Longimicrobiales bacterium]
MRNRIRATARAGFTLIEVLVTLVLLALLLGVIVPQVINQLDRGDPTRIIGDLEGIRSSVKMFRIDVKRYPSTLEQLTENPYDGTDYGTNWSDSTALPGGTINTNLKERWEGPYLEGVLITDPTAETLGTALGGEIDGEFTVAELGGVEYLVIVINELAEDDILAVDEEFDDGDVTTGRIQESGTDPDFLLHYYAVPLN